MMCSELFLLYIFFFFLFFTKLSICQNFFQVFNQGGQGIPSPTHDPGTLPTRSAARAGHAGQSPSGAGLSKADLTSSRQEEDTNWLAFLPHQNN